MTQPNNRPLVFRAVRPPVGVKDEYPVAGDTVTVGRHPSNDLNVPADSVSRFHARIAKQDGEFVVTDLESSNGTFYDDQRVKSARLEPGHKVMFGNVEFEIGLDDTRRDPRGIEERLLETPVHFVGSDRKRSRLIFEAQVGRRDTTPIQQFVKGPLDREELDKAYKQLATLYKLSDILRSMPEEQSLLESFLDLVFEVMPADRGVVLLRETPEDEVVPRVSRSRQLTDGDKPIAMSQTIIDRCMDEKIAILSQDALSDQRFKAADSVLLHDIRSTIVVPLISHGDILGIIHLDTRESAQAFDDDDLHFVTNLADDLALYLGHNRALEEIRRNQEMAAVGNVITDLAHNIKNILLLAEGGIKLMDRLIDSGDLDKVQQNWELTQKTLGRISTMVKQMLDYTRAPQINLKSGNVNRIIRETCESYKTEFEDKGIAVKLRLDKRVEDGTLDIEGLERCLVNLLVNACEAIQHDNGEIIVTSVVRPTDWVVSIGDNGEGIEPDKLSRIFYPRFSTKGEKGTGLGLAWVKKWTTAIGGSVHAKSVVHEGTRFAVIIPREVSSTVTSVQE